MQKIAQTLLGKLETEWLDKLSEDLKVKIKGKQKLTLEEQIEYMQAKGIQFNLMTEDKALAYLSENSYYRIPNINVCMHSKISSNFSLTEVFINFFVDPEV